MKKTILLFLLFTAVLSISAQTKSYNLLIGTYTNTGKSEGIYSYNIDFKNDIISQKSVAKGVENPSFMAITPDRKFIYSVNQNDKTSTISSFSFDTIKSQLSLLNKVDAIASGPCFISVTKNHVFTANYNSGSIAVFGRKKDGTLTKVQQLIQHVGKSINSERQGEPHVHQVIISPDNKYVVANDLGTDKVTVYKYNPTSTTSVLIPYDTLSVKPGSGPRHSTFSKDGTKLYLVQEIDGSVSVLGFKNGKLNLIQETTVDYKSGIINRTADIHLSPDERYLYVTNRGNANDISCFTVTKDGKLIFKQQVSTGGDGPRNFAISPDGEYVFVAHQNTDNIVIFKRDIKTGLLTDTGKQIKVGSPVCLLFY